MTKRILLCIVAISLCAAAAHAAIRDEWSFKDDAAGTTLNGAINSGSDHSSFDPGGTGLLEADGMGLLQSTPAGIGLWDGVELDANVADRSVLYLRYDLEYDFSSPYYTDGSSLGVSFVDEVGGKLAGLMFAYEEQGAGSAPPGKILLKVAGGFENSGALIAIAKVDASTGTMSVWYKLNQTAELVESKPAAQIDIDLATIRTLRVQAAGDAIPPGSDDYVAVENIRTAETWEEINAIVDVGPILSEDQITIRVAPGETASASVELFNTSLNNLPFTVTDDGLLPGRYEWESGNSLRYPFDYAYPDTIFTWLDGESVPMEIGFDFVFFGNAYQQFSVDQFGKLTLLSGGGLEAVVVPFESSSAIEISTLRYRKEADRLIVAWGNGSGQEFQAWLNADGTIECFYEFGTWDGWIGLVDEQGTRYPFDYIPGQIRLDSWLITSIPWVTYPPDSGSISGASSESLTFTASPDDDQEPGTYPFAAFVEWAGEIVEIEVTVIVEPALYQLDVPATFNFSGPAGSISPDAVMTVTNSGNVSLTYTLYNNDLREAGYAEVESDYSWFDIPNVPQYELDESQLDSEPVSVGFPFVYLGNTYTELIVEADGTLAFDNGDEMVVFSNGQQTDVNSKVWTFSSADATRFVVTWDYLVKPDGNSDQRFQAILHRDGRIQFNYRRMTEDWQEGKITLIPFDPNRLENSGFEDATIDPWKSEGASTLSLMNVARTGAQSAKVEFPGYDGTGIRQNVTVGEGEQTFNIRYSANGDGFPALLGLRVTIFETGGTIQYLDYEWITAGDTGWHDFSYEYTKSDPSVSVIGYTIRTFPQALPGDPPANKVPGHFLIDDCELELIEEDKLGTDPDPITASLVTDQNTSTEPLYGTVSVTNWVGGVPFVDDEDVVVGTQTTYQSTITSRAIEFMPGEPGIISYSPVSATLAVGATAEVTLKGDARTLDANQSVDATLLFTHPGDDSPSDVTFTATSPAATPAAELRAAMWGAEEPLVSSTMNADGSRTLSWPAPSDSLSRTYQIWYTLSLTERWTLLDTVNNATTFIDDMHNDEPVIFYKVTVQ